MSEKQIVHTSSLFEVDKSFDDPRFMRVRINAMTTGVNLNGSRFSLECIENALDTFKNIPVLAHVIKTTDEDGNEILDYNSHDMHIEQDAFDKTKTRMIYDEVVVGVIPETNSIEIVKNEDTEEHNVFVTALLYRDYGNYACDVLESRGGKTDVSMEIFCDDISYDANAHCLDVGSMVASGVTLLGDDCTPAMPGANAETFSSNSENRNEQLVRIMQELKESLDNYTTAINAAQNLEKGGKSQMDKFSELLEKYGKTESDITFEYADLDDEALEKAFSDAFDGEGTTSFEENTKPQNDGGEAEAEESEVVTIDDDETEDEAEAESDAEPETSDDDADSFADEDPKDDDADDANDDASDANDDANDVDDTDDVEKKFEMSLKLNDEVKTTFSTLNEQLNALFELVNNTYADQDGTFYSIDADPDKKYVYMFDFWDGSKAYRQSYKVKSDVFSLVGDRSRVFAKYYTDDEIKQIDALNFELQQAKESLAKYEAEPKKIELLESSDYDKIKETPEYKELAKRESYFALDTGDLAKKLDDILLSYAKNNKLDFATKDTKEEKKSDFFAFARIESNTSFLDGLLRK